MKHVPPPALEGSPPPTEPSLRSKTVNGALWNLVASSSIQIMSLAIFILLARQLNASDLGVVMLAVLIVNFLSIFVKEGIQEHLVQKPEWDTVFVSTAFWIMLGVGIILTLITAFVVAPIFGYLYGGHLREYIQVLSPTLLFGAASTINTAKTRRAFQFRTQAILNFNYGMVSGIAALGLFWIGFGAWSLIWSRVAASLGSAVILWMAAPFRPTLVATLRDARELVRFSTPIWSSRVLSYFAAKAAELGLAFVIGPAALALFRIGGRVNETITALLLVPIVSVSLSAFSRTDKDRIASTFIRFNIVLCAVTIPIYFGGAAIAGDFVNIFFGSRWADASLIMTLSLLAAVPVIVRTLIPAALKAANATDQLYRFSAVEVGTGIISTAATVLFGPVAVAVGNTAGQYVSLFLNRGVLWKGLRLHVFDILSSILPYILAAAGMFALVEMFSFLAVSWVDWPRMITSVAIGGVSYPLLLVLFGRRALVRLVGEIKPLLPRGLQSSAGRVRAVLEGWT